MRSCLYNLRIYRELKNKHFKEHSDLCFRIRIDKIVVSLRAWEAQGHATSKECYNHRGNYETLEYALQYKTMADIEAKNMAS